jgi:hypothetical protein
MNKTYKELEQLRKIADEYDNTLLDSDKQLRKEEQIIFSWRLNYKLEISTFIEMRNKELTIQDLNRIIKVKEQLERWKRGEDSYPLGD